MCIKKKPITTECLIEKMKRQMEKEKNGDEVRIGKLYNLNKWTLEILNNASKKDIKSTSIKDLKATYDKFYKTFKNQIDPFNRKLNMVSKEMKAILKRKTKDPFHKISLEDLKDIEPRISESIFEITDVFPKYPTLEDEYVKTYFEFQEKCRDEFHWIDKKTLEKK